jgi:hypothetical protein
MRCHWLTPGDQREFREDLATPVCLFWTFCQDFSYRYGGIFIFVRRACFFHGEPASTPLAL